MCAVRMSEVARLSEPRKGQATFPMGVWGLASSKAYVAQAQLYVNRCCRKTRFEKDICISEGFLKKRAVGTSGEIQIELLYLH